MTRLRAESFRFTVAGAIVLASFAVAPIGPQGCAYLQTPQGQTTLAEGEQIANVALSAAATVYGGPVAGQLASAGLSGIATVLQSYVGQQAPAPIIAKSAGVRAVGPAVAPIVTKQTVTQSAVNAVWQAAAIAKKK